MDPKVLVKEFRRDPGAAFIEMIRTSPKPLDARTMKSALKAAGASPADVDRRWARVQPFVNGHPHVRKPKPTQYEWASEPIESATALNRLTARLTKTTPAWYVDALIAAINDTLAMVETSGPRASTSWTHQRRISIARRTAELLAGTERLVNDGVPSAAILAWIDQEADRGELMRSPVVGERIPFEPGKHEIEGRSPSRGEPVTVVRSGFVWAGADSPAMVLSPAVRAPV